MTWNPEHAPISKIQPMHSPRNPFEFLPAFYAQAVARPSAHFFSHTAEYARWSLVWLQLAFIVLIPELMGWIRSLVHDTSTGVNAKSNIFLSALSIITVSASIFAFIIKIVAIPLIFFVGVGLQYLTAKALRGHGRFVSHCFSIQTYQVPLAIISGLITLIFVLLHFSTLFFSPLVSIALFIYGIFINISVVMGVHTLSREKAILTVLIPYVLCTLVICGGLAFLAHTIADNINAMR